MAKRGRAGSALGIAALGSFFAGCVATLLIAAFAPPLTELAFQFGPAEYFSLMVLGLVSATVLATGSLLKAICMVLLGLLLGLIGTDVNSGAFRFTFGLDELQDGIDFVPLSMGLFGFAEIMRNLEGDMSRQIRPSVRLRQHPRRCRSRISQQCWCTNVVCPHAHARHPFQRRNGSDDRRHDDSRHCARTSGHAV